MRRDKPVLTRLTVGSTVTIPRGAFHSTFNIGWDPVQILAIYSPPGPELAMKNATDFVTLPPRRAARQRPAEGLNNWACRAALAISVPTLARGRWNGKWRGVWQKALGHFSPTGREASVPIKLLRRASGVADQKGRAMTKLSRLVLLAGLLFGVFAVPSAQAQSDRAPADIQKSYGEFIKTFRAALKANDPAAVTALTAFPFYWDEMRDAEYFRKQIYAKIFTRKVRDCIARGRGFYARDGAGKHNFTIFCGEDLYLFTTTPQGFRFAEVGVND